MKPKIKNIHDLKAERARLKNEIELSKTKMRSSIDAIKEELSPARHIVSFLGNFLTNRNKGLLNVGLGLGVDSVIRNGLLRRAPWPLKVLVPFFLKNFAGNVIHNNKDNIMKKGIEWVRDITTETPKPLLTEVKGLSIEKPSLVEKALLWVKDVTDEKPAELKIVSKEDKPSFVERALLWVKDITEEKPRPIQVVHVNGHTPTTVSSE
ncbi:hypothetical protein [Emticicia sp. BO119]|uniref:hypothetical protein n=1 Tax=Emticicia sp. BO119 TaxID=2757768 RepID=UPI0015F0BC42|nr:hypothetical protein [Emticicia sp. BO119]MBA4854005.1 hypothetical protein [Emticicia sp. BO119]